MRARGRGCRAGAGASWLVTQ
ncbi:DNA-formamidopyrimidine glycosylase, partial [Streptomyces ipomoeae 91-03]